MHLITRIFNKKTLWKYAGLLLVVMFLVLTFILNTQEFSHQYEFPILLGFLNTLFLCLMPLGMAYLAAKSYQSTSATGFLMAGCGLVFFGISSFYAGWVMPLAGNPNPTVTLHNLGSLFAGICQLLGVHFFLQDVMGIEFVRTRVPSYKILYIGIFAMVSTIAILAYQGILPIFFDPFTGPSTIRQFVLVGAIFLFALSGMAFLEIYITAKTAFAYWYGLALWLIAIGLTGVLLQHGVGSPLGWIGRIAQYVAGTFLIIAFLQGRWERSQSGDRISTIKSTWTLWPYFEQRVGERTSILVQTNQALQKEISERKKADKTLQNIIDKNPMAMQIVNKDGFTLEVNPAHIRLFGSTPPADYSIFSSFRNRPKEFGDLLQRVITHGEVVNFPDVYSNAHDINPNVPDVPVWIRTSCFPLNDEHEKLDRLVFTYENITARKQAELRVICLIRLYATLSQVNQTIVRASNRQELFDEICRVAIKYGEFRLAWIGLFDLHSGLVSPVAIHGYQGIKLPFDEINAIETPFKNGLTGLAISSGQVQYSHNIQSDPRMSHWKEAAKKDGYHAAAAIPMCQNGQVIGLLNLYASDVDFFTSEEEQSLLAEMGMDISFALDNLQREAERKQAGLELARIAERLNLATHAAQMGIWDWDIQKNELVWDERMFELYGIGKEEIQGAYQTWLNGIHPDDRAASDAASEQARRGESEYDTEFRIVRPDGNFRWLKANGQVFRDASGVPVRMIGVNYDITERKQAESALRESEEKYRLLFANNPNPMLVFDEDSLQIIAVNDSAIREYEWSKDEFLNLSILDIRPNEDRALAKSVIDQNRGKSETGIGVFRHCKKNGTIMDMEITISSIMFNGRNGRLCLMNNVTKRKRAEEAARESRAQLDTALESMTDAVFISDADGKFIIFNQAFATFHKFKSKAECLKTLVEYPNILDVFMDSGELAPLDMWAVPRALRGEIGVNVEYSLRRKDTGENWVGSYSFAPIRNIDGVIVGSVVVGRDITERKRAEDALRESEAQLKFSQQVAHVGHWTWDTVTNQVTWSDEMKRIFGVDPTAFDGDMDKVIAEAIHPDDREKVNASNISVLSEQKPVPLEYRVIWQDKSIHTIWAEAGARILNDQGMIIKLSGIVQDISERKKAEEKIEKSLAEKEALLRELYHRTRNNMAVIIALLDMQASEFDDARLLEAFIDAQNRIRSMALVHQKLYETKDLSHINLKDYINDLLVLMLKVYDISSNSISIISEMEDVLVLIDSAVPCGLVLNELISYMLKYAFKNKENNEIRLRLHKTEHNVIELDIANNGMSAPPGFNFRQDGHMGMQNIFFLVENQLMGQVTFDTHQGVSCQIKFQDIYYEPRV